MEKLEIEFAKGELAWNPYSHNSLVQGSVNVGGEVYTYDHTTQFRAYPQYL